MIEAIVDIEERSHTGEVSTRVTAGLAVTPTRCSRSRMLSELPVVHAVAGVTAAVDQVMWQLAAKVLSAKLGVVYSAENDPN